MKHKFCGALVLGLPMGVDWMGGGWYWQAALIGAVAGWALVSALGRA